MAATKKQTGFRDGVRKDAPGKYTLRITWLDGLGKRRDTDRVFYCETRPEAVQEHARLAQELRLKTSTSWTVERALAAYLQTVRPSTRQAWTSHAGKINAVFGQRQLTSVQPAELQRFLVALPIADVTAQNVRTVLVRLWDYAKSQGQFSGANPALETKPRRTHQTDEEMLRELENPPRRAMIGDEIGRFLSHLNPDVRPLITIQLLLGCRFGEASALQWVDIDWTSGRVRIVRGQFRGQIGPNKKRKLRYAGLGPMGLQLLQTHRERMAEAKWPGWETWCFPRPLSGRLRDHDLWPAATAIQYVKQAQKAAGVDVVSRTHSMRHTFITSAEAARATDTEAALVRAMVGHASTSQHAHYIDPRALSASALGGKHETTLLGGRLGNAPTEEQD